MLARLLIGIVKGLVVGGLIGFGLVKLMGLGVFMSHAWLAYVAAALTGVLIGLVAGKPIWAKDAKIEAGMKAFVGALLGAGLMFAVRKWLTMPLPLPESVISALGAAKADQPLTLGNFAMTSLAAIAALLGGFYDADNTPEPAQDASKASGAKAPAQADGAKKRIAASADDELEDEELDASEKKRGKK